MADCWNCPKHGELRSLRASVKRFESDSEYMKLKKQTEADRERRIQAESQMKSMRAEYNQLKSRAEDAEKKLESANRKIDKQTSKIRSLTRKAEEQQALLRKRDSQIGKLLKPFKEALNDIRCLETEERNPRIHNTDEEEKSPLKSDEKEFFTDEEIEAIANEIADLKDKLKAKEAQLKNNSTNCSTPSSMCMNRPPTNNREPSDKNPGGQPGHIGHGRKPLEPDAVITLKVPEEILNNPSLYEKTKEKKIRQVHSVELTVKCIQYEAFVYRNKSTKKCVWARFPSGVVNDINYDASVKALACMLHSHGNMSYEKVQEVISELTDGKLHPSTGFLNGLEREFSDKSVLDRQHIWERMKRYPYMHVDGTTIYVNGRKRTILVCTSPAGTLYFYSDHKGHKAVKKSVLFDYEGTVISDGESTFFNYGKTHQGCLEHELRYLKGSMENETDLTWAGMMRELLREAIHKANEARRNEQDKLNPSIIKEIEQRYDQIIKLAESEYELYQNHLKYYKKGFNTMKRLRDHKEFYLNFLHDLTIPATNSRAEQKARAAKMHVKQSGGYRDESGNAVQFYCDTLALLSCTSDRGGSRYRMIYSVFSREMPVQRPSTELIEQTRKTKQSKKAQ